MKFWLKKDGWLYWLGLSLTIFSTMNIFCWEFWAIAIPLIILVEWKIR